ncbi:MAG: histidinol-phosphatase HisJ family protein [Theionarchaea archaeon]|nr:histidinol-phosphatase HisJ family protein [Theionarchaea archaeon]MBU7000574.1 histidinol-phosphatase HisJ family protein [Theionarchaea archaeon]MBU7039769.1 histidinol-phosphatase HisJ family protein [Theionarchaea archaeon]
MIDYHIHSTFSIDGRSHPRDYVCSAADHSLEEFGFSEHVDLDPTWEGYNYLDYSRYHEALEKLREEFALTIKCGIELSYQKHLEPSIRAYLSSISCDYVIGSVHDVNGISMDDTFLEHATPCSYFEAVKDMTTSGMIDIVGHLEYFKRWGGDYSSSDYKAAIVPVLQTIVEQNLFLEVNTSGLRHPVCDTYPSLCVMEWYRALGGTLITLGSDAHEASQVAFQFEPVLFQLKEIGFNQVVIFDGRTWCYHPL